MIYNQLFDWQKRIIDTFKSRKSFGLWLSMGLGKTPVSLAMAEANNCDKVIIVTVNAKACESESIPGSWLEWAKKSGIKYKFFKKNADPLEFKENEPELLLVNYEGLFERKEENKVKSVTVKRYIEEFIKKSANHNLALIIDESHKMKSLQSTQTKAIFEMRRLCLRYSVNLFAYLLTGTPFTTGYIDLYSQLKMLGCNMTKGQFMDEFCVRGQLPGLLAWQQPIVGYRNVAELYKLVHQYAITIETENVIDLPEQIFHDIVLPQSKQFVDFTYERLSGRRIQQTLIERHLDNEVLNYDFDKKTNNPFFRNIAYPDLKWLADTNGLFWLRARELSIGFQGNATEAAWYDKSRIDALRDFLRDNKDNYVIFYNYIPELLEIFNVCNDLGYNIDVYSGVMKNLSWYEKYAQDEANNIRHDKCNVILANFASGSTGMNWQLYNKCVIFSLPVYKDWAQGLKRVHRIGQKKTVVYYVFRQDNWLDNSMKNALETRQDYTQDMFEADLLRIQQMTGGNEDENA